MTCTKDQLKEVRNKIVAPKIRTRTSPKVSKTDLLDVFLASDTPETLTLEELVEEFCIHNREEPTNEITQAIAKALRDIDGWIADATTSGKSKITVRFNVNQISEPLIDFVLEGGDLGSANILLELIPSAVEKVFQPQSPCDPEQAVQISDRFMWLTGLFPISLLVSCTDTILATVARAVSQLTLGRLRSEINACLLNSESVYYLFEPAAIKSPRELALNNQIRTVLAEAVYAARLEAPDGCELGHIKNVAFGNLGYAGFANSSTIEDFRKLRQNNQFVYIAEPLETCDSPLPVLVIGNRTFVSFPSCGCPDAISVERLHHQFDSHNREFFREVVALIDRGEAIAVDGSDAKQSV